MFLQLRDYLRKIYHQLSLLMSHFLKKLLGNEAFLFIAAKILSIIMKISYKTTKWTIIGENIPEKYHKSKKPFIVCLWHDRLMLAPCVWKWEKPLHVLASAHRDGKLIAKTVKNFSMIPVYGSTGKGIAAAKELIKLGKNGEYIAIIPDGPRGPRHKPAPGIISIAKLADIDIITYSFCVKKYSRFSSWDKFIFVWPFNKGVMVWGKPITSAELKQISEKEAVALIENRINSLSEEAYRKLLDV